VADKTLVKLPENFDTSLFLVRTFALFALCC